MSSGPPSSSAVMEYRAWASEGEVRTAGAPFRTTEAEAQIVARPARSRDHHVALLRRRCRSAAGEGARHRPHMYGTLWHLTQGDTRKTKRVRLFTEFVSRRLAA